MHDFALASDKGLELRAIDTGRRQALLNDLDILDIQFSAPERWINRFKISRDSISEIEIDEQDPHIRKA